LADCERFTWSEPDEPVAWAAPELAELAEVVDLVLYELISLRRELLMELMVLPMELTKDLLLQPLSAPLVWSLRKTGVMHGFQSC
jgi:hypothetical protein